MPKSYPVIKIIKKKEETNENVLEIPEDRLIDISEGCGGYKISEGLGNAEGLCGRAIYLQSAINGIKVEWEIGEVVNSPYDIYVYAIPLRKE